MIRSIYTGMTGMKTFQNALSITSNNIANSQTIGHKSQKAIFEDLFYENKTGRKANDSFAGTNPLSIGNGVQMGAIKSNLAQGTVNYTGGKTDIAIEGEGYFIVGTENGESWEYTRKGTFRLSEDQKLTTTDGQYVMGWNIDPMTGKVDTTKRPTPIFIPLEAAMQGKESTEAKISGNIDFDMLQGSSSRMQFPVYDSVGKRISVEMEFVKTANGEFEYVAIPNESFVKSDNIKGVYFNTRNAYDDLVKGIYSVKVDQDPAKPGTGALVTVTDKDGNVVVNQQAVDNVDQAISLKGSDGKEFMTVEFKALAAGAPSSTATITVGEVGTMKFDVKGNLESITPKGGLPSSASTVDFISNSNGTPVSVNLDLKSITSFATDTSLVVESANGNAAASVRDFNISDDGNIQVLTSDGGVTNVAKVALASFANNEGLMRVGKGNYIESTSSGMARIYESGMGNVGVIRASSLENSNVDLSTEFIDLMIYQKSFQANTKIIQISDEVVTGVINLIR